MSLAHRTGTLGCHAIVSTGLPPFVIRDNSDAPALLREISDGLIDTACTFARACKTPALYGVSSLACFLFGNSRPSNSHQRKPNRTVPNRTGPGRTEPGPHRTRPRKTGRNGPNRTETEQAEPDRTKPNQDTDGKRTEPDRAAEPDRTGPNQEEPRQPNQTEPKQPSRTEPNKDPTEPNQSTRRQARHKEKKTKNKNKIEHLGVGPLRCSQKTDANNNAACIKNGMLVRGI